MVRPLSQQTFDRLVLDIYPSYPAQVDFGIVSTKHYGALQHAVKHDEVTVEQLDEALGSGPKLTALVAEDNPYHGVVFHTFWDDMGGDNDEEEDDMDAEYHRQAIIDDESAPSQEDDDELYWEDEQKAVGNIHS